MKAMISDLELKILYAGPFVLDSVVTRKSEAWKRRLDSKYGVNATITLATPPFQTGDLECKGYWLKPEGNTHEKRVKSLRKQMNSALVSLLTEVEKFRPRFLLGGSVRGERL